MFDESVEEQRERILRTRNTVQAPSSHLYDCHECNCHLHPPCGACEKCVHWDVEGCENDCQTCEYDHWRTGPYRKEDGTWSDGIDRSDLIFCRDTSVKRWEVYTEFGVWFTRYQVGDRYFMIFEEFETFDEAIAYADKQARLKPKE